MTDILNFQVKDTALTDVISNNPFYINIKGSVNICLIRCGQEIESCNDVYFSTMTNYGKILVLNPNPNKVISCNIKLAYDTSNDNLNNNGSGNYVFERVFMTVPSLHQLNGQIFDMETFMVFSSVQKNGNVLYTCLCSFSSATNNIPQSNDWKLLNYKLMNELLVKNNTVPDLYGTNSISGIPNPVDLSTFIPQEGSRNFYDYTHPQNTKVNFRIFQTPLLVSNEVISTLKTKLTPGTVYTNFRNAISKVINPLEGLFFYFSEDLTNIYKSYKSNETTTNSTNESFDNEPETKEEEENFKKLETSKIEEEEEKSSLENKLEKEKMEDTFSNNEGKTNLSLTYMIFLFAIFLISNYAGTHIITNIFTSQENLDDSTLKKSVNAISTDIATVLAIRFKLYFNLLIQSFFTIIIILILIYSILSNNNYKDINNGFIILFSIFILFNGIFSVYLKFRYIFNRLKGVYDDDFSQKENYLTSYIFKNLYKNGNLLDNLWNLYVDENFKDIIGNNNTQSGGDFNAAPGPAEDNHSNMKAAEFKITFTNHKLTSLKSISDLITSSFFRTKLSENPKWGKNVIVYLFYLIIFFIIILILNFYFLLSNYNNTGVTILLKMLPFIFSYIPTIILPNILNTYFCYETSFFNKILKYIILGLCCIGVLFYIISIFIPNFFSMIFIYISTLLVVLAYLILLVLYFFRKRLEYLVGKFAGKGTDSTNQLVNKSSTDINDTKIVTDGTGTISTGKIPINDEQLLKIIEEKNNALEKAKLLEEKINQLESSKSDSSIQISNPNLKLHQNLQDERDKSMILKKEIERLKQNINLKKEDEINKQSKTTIDQLQQQIENLKQTISNPVINTSKIEEAQSKIDELQQQIVGHKQEIENLKQTINNPVVNNSKIVEAQSKINELQQQIIGQEQEIENLKQTISNPVINTSKIEELQQQIENLKQKLSKPVVNSNKIEASQSRIEQLQKQIDELQKQKKSNNNNISSQNEIAPNFVGNSDDESTITDPSNYIANQINKLKLLAQKNRKNIKDKYINILDYIINSILNITLTENSINRNNKIIAIINKLLKKDNIDFIKIKNNISQLGEEKRNFNLINNIKNILMNIKQKLNSLNSLNDSDSDYSM